MLCRGWFFTWATLLLPMSLFAQDELPGLKGLTYRNIGPAAGGRLTRVAGVPGDPNTYYAGASAGGLWKSTDGGITWKPIMDDMPVSSIGSLAVAPSNPNVIYVGAGEANIRSNVTAGNGIYKSSDAGKTWSHVWKQVGQIGTMIVHPKDPDIAFAAVLGKVSGPNPERGVYRTRDGGKSWQRVLFVDADTGASDVCFDLTNPEILFAGTWQARRVPWQLTSGGPGSGLYTSRDGGTTWKKLTGKGLPQGVWGKVGVAVAPSDGRRVYAIIEAEKGGLFRSDDGGENWTLTNDGRGIRQRAWYYSTVTVDPTNPDIVWCPNVPMLRSIDAGKTFQMVLGFHHGDHHDIWIDPTNPKRMIDANDGGADVTTNGGQSWYACPLPIGQFYRINVDNRTPFYVSGTMQDIGCMAGPSDSLTRRGINLSEWQYVGGGETGYTAHDPTDPNIIYAGEYAGIITRFDMRTRQARNISVYPYSVSGEAELRKYRFRWPAPLMLSPHDPKVLYHAANVLFRTNDAGMTWQAISGDLTRNDKSKQGWSGGPITGDNTSAEHYCTISALAESPRLRGLLWVGSDDGLVHISRDGGKSWLNVTKNIPGLPEWGTIKMIEASRHADGTAYLVVDAHLLDNVTPYLYRTTDFGASWQLLSKTLPQDVYLHVVREDPKQSGLLYVGTEQGVVFSYDSGKSWHRLKLNLPTVAVHDMVVKDNSLVLGTNGRSIWILDDLHVVREYRAELLKKPVHFYEPAAAIRWRRHYTRREPSPGENPPHGAVLHYWLASEPKQEIRLEVRDAENRLITTLTSTIEPQESEEVGAYSPPEERKPDLTAKQGLNKVVWNLTHKGGKAIPRAKIDSGDPEAGPLVVPGKYKLTLLVGDHRHTVDLEVKPDPRLSLTARDYIIQRDFCLQVRDELTRLTNIVEHLRKVRGQLEHRNPLIQELDKAKALHAASAKLIERLTDLEERLHNPRARISYDIFAHRGGAKLYSKLGMLYDVALGSDGLPTQGMRELFKEHQAELAGYAKEWKQLLANDLRTLNELAKKLDLPVILP